MFISAYDYQLCVLVGGPCDGSIETIATIGKDSPCDVKIFPDSTYRIRLETPTKRARDSQGRFILDWVED